MPDSTLTETPYTAAQRAVSEAHDEMDTLRKRHTAEKDAAQAKIDEAVETLRHVKAGTNPDTKALAESVIEVARPSSWEVEDGPRMLQEAITDLTQGYPHLRTRMFACKSYASWPGQRCDTEYGYSPKHGSHTFVIAFTKEVRERLKDDGELTPEEIEAAVQYLTNLPDFVRNGGETPSRNQDVRF